MYISIFPKQCFSHLNNSCKITNGVVITNMSTHCVPSSVLSSYTVILLLHLCVFISPECLCNSIYIFTFFCVTEYIPLDLSECQLPREKNQ